MHENCEDGSPGPSERQHYGNKGGRLWRGCPHRFLIDYRQSIVPVKGYCSFRAGFRHAFPGIMLMLRILITGDKKQVPKRRSNKDVPTKRANTQKSRGRKPPHPEPGKETALPEFYHKTEVVLLPVDPYLVYAYWEVTDVDLKRAKRKLKKEFEGARAALRFYDLTDTAKNEKGRGSYFDVEIELSARSLFVPLWSPGKTYRVELGVRVPAGRFVCLAGSNIAGHPSASAEGNTDERFVKVTDGLEIVEFDDDSVSLEILSGEAEHPGPMSHAVMPEILQSEKPSTTGETEVSVTGSSTAAASGKQSANSAIHEEVALHPKADRGSSFDLTARCAEQFELGVSSSIRSREID
jgi:hypothetical protein